MNPSGTPTPPGRTRPKVERLRTVAPRTAESGVPSASQDTLSGTDPIAASPTTVLNRVEETSHAANGAVDRHENHLLEKGLRVSIRRDELPGAAADRCMDPVVARAEASENGRFSANPERNGELGNFSPADDVSNGDVTDHPDLHLISECLAGRIEAFDALMLRYQDRLYNSLVRMVRSAEDARDIAQEAWIHAYQGLGTFRGNSTFYSWLFKIAYHSVADEKRRRRVGGASIDGMMESTGYEPHEYRPDADPTSRLEQNDRVGQVRAALDQLSDEFRTVLVLKEMENLAYDEIAELVGCPIGTVRSRIHRARAELALKLRPLIAEDSL